MRSGYAVLRRNGHRRDMDRVWAQPYRRKKKPKPKVVSQEPIFADVPGLGKCQIMSPSQVRALGLKPGQKVPTGRPGATAG